MTKEEILAKFDVLDPSKIGKDGKIGMMALNLTRDGYVHTVKMILKAMEEYGKEQYNQAIEDAIENAEIDYFLESHYFDEGYECIHSVDKDSILKLKKL